MESTILSLLNTSRMACMDHSHSPSLSSISTTLPRQQPSTRSKFLSSSLFKSSLGTQTSSSEFTGSRSQSTQTGMKSKSSTSMSTSSAHLAALPTPNALLWLISIQPKLCTKTRSPSSRERATSTKWETHLLQRLSSRIPLTQRSWLSWLFTSRTILGRSLTFLRSLNRAGRMMGCSFNSLLLSPPSVRSFRWVWRLIQFQGWEALLQMITKALKQPLLNSKPQSSQIRVISQAQAQILHRAQQKILQWMNLLPWLCSSPYWSCPSFIELQQMNSC